MSAVTVGPSVLSGRTRAPSSKSYTHRALVAAHLADRPSTLLRPLVSDDTLRTAHAVRALGSRVRFGRSSWTVTPARFRPRTARTIDCGESGTTLRFCAALAALESVPVRLLGSGRLPQRPMGPLVDALRTLGAEVRTPARGAGLPLEVRGPIHGGAVTLDATVSSQFTSALLLVRPAVRPGSTVRLRGAAVSEPYVRATISLLRERGIHLRPTPRGFVIPGGQRYSAGRRTIPGDASSAAYLWAGGAASSGSVEVSGIPGRWPQADLAVLDILRSYGAVIRRSGDRVRVTGRYRRPFRVDLDACPDLFPLAGALAASAPGVSVLTGAAHAAAKESDRRAGTARLARAMGASVRLSTRSLTIDGTAAPKPLRFEGAHDHRLVMSAAVGALAATGPSRIGEAECVAKSFPEFFDTLRHLGAEVGRP